MSPKIAFALIYWTIQLLILSNSAWATNYCVSTSGSDSNDGLDDASPSCWLTIGRANSTVKAGDNVKVNSGVYAPSATITTSVSGTSSQRIRYYSATNYGAIIRHTGGTYAWNNTGNYITIEGFDLDGVNTARLTRIGLINSGTNPNFINNKIHDYIGDLASGYSGSGAQGISNSGSGTPLTATGNQIYNIGLNPGGPGNHGIYDASTGGSTIANNLIHDVRSTGILVYPNNTTLNTISGNTIYNTSTCIWIVSGNDHNIFNNLIYNCNTTGAGYGGIRIQTNSNKIRGNTVGGSTSSNINLSSASLVGNQIQNNIVYPGAITNPNPAGNPSNNNLTTNPSFVNAGAGNFQLQAGSAAIGAGTTLGAPYNVDILGVSRPQGAAYDIGAHEYSASGTALLAPTNLAVTP